MYTYDLPISEIIKLSPTAVAIRLNLQGKEFHFTPGQYAQIELKLEEIDGFKVYNNLPKMQKRTLSISSSPNERKYLEFTIKAIPNGFVSKYMVYHLKLGDTMKIRGPLGRFIFDEKNTKENIIFLAAGSGISPIMSILRYINENKININTALLYSNKFENEILWREEIENIARDSNNIKHLLTLTQQQWSGNVGRINKELFFQFCKDKENTDIYICGPLSFVRGMEMLLKDIPSSAIKKEIF